jgi:hypothetical protein
LLAVVLVSEMLAELMMMSNIRLQQLNYHIVVVLDAASGAVVVGGGAVDSGGGGCDNVKH